MFFIKVVLDDDKLGHTKSVQLISFLSLFCRVSTHSPLSWANLPVDRSADLCYVSEIVTNVLTSCQSSDSSVSLGVHGVFMHFA